MSSELEQQQRTPRKIFIVGDISMEGYNKFTRRLSKLERESSDVVEVELLSPGGDAYAALAYAGRIRSSDCMIAITGHGLIASAAVMILASGDHRVMSREAWLMCHEDHGELSGEVTDLEKSTSHLRRLENQWAKLLARCSYTNMTAWTKIHRNTTYLCAKECLDLGLIEDVI